MIELLSDLFQAARFTHFFHKEERIATKMTLTWVGISLLILAGSIILFVIIKGWDLWSRDREQGAAFAERNKATVAAPETRDLERGGATVNN